MNSTKKEWVPFEQTTYIAQVRRLRKLAILALESFAIKVASVEFINHGENATFKVTAKNGEKFLLRIHRKGYHSRPALIEELRWLELLSRHEVDAPRPVRSKLGKSIIAVAHPGTSVRNCDLLRWTEGRFLSKSISESDMFKIGVLLATIQNIGRKLNCRHRKYWSSEGLVGASPKLGSIDEIGALRKEEQQKLTATRKALLTKLKDYERAYSEKMGMIHADLHFGNLLKTNTGHIAAIDFDDCGYGFYVYDIVVPLVGLEHHLRLHKRLRSYQTLKKALLAGYSSVTELKVHDLALLQDLIIARKLLMIGWMHSRSDNPKIKGRLIKYARQTLKYIAKPNL